MMARSNHPETWPGRLARLAADLYPDRYSASAIQHLAALAREVRHLAKAKGSFLLAHNYVLPELQEVAGAVGDSLGLCRQVAQQRPRRVEFCGVWFMGETARIILGPESAVYMPGRAGCSLADSVDHDRLRQWINAHPGGIVIAYVNCDARTKALSDFVCTSANAPQVIQYAAHEFPGRPVLFLPDRYLGALARAAAPPTAGPIDIYDGCCHVHAAINEEMLGKAIERHPEAELLIHPECACVSSLLRAQPRLGSGQAPPRFFSTEQMVVRARESPAREFIVATELGMVYRLRKENPDKTFHPVSRHAICEFMKANTLEKLLRSLQTGAFEVRLDPAVIQRARLPIARMLAIH